MRLGVLIPTRGVVMRSARRPPLEECWELARAADEAGLDAIWVGDSVVAKPRLEALTTLAYLAGITKRVRLGTAVLLPALRQPVVQAQQIANVDQISGGRLVIGVGVGWNLPSAEREWAACGMDHRRRTRLMEEQLALWRQLWRGQPLTQAGDGYALSEHTIGPLPWRDEGPPILITAGNRGELYPAQLERLARLGDGIITTYLEPSECISLRQRAVETLAAHGRNEPDFPLCVYTTVRIEDDRATAERITTAFLEAYYGGDVRRRGLMGLGPAGAVVEMIERYAEAGVTDICIRFAGEDQRGQMERFVDEVLSKWQAAGRS
jgi:alkanesulfonate monooxygenase SsuD/methylene tetrahydromethanopterin reductase-like flavin-dependent oxidoreductase (luciferase family)